MSNPRLMITLVACVLCGDVSAATSSEIEAAFAKAQRKGADAIYHERCGADGTSSGGILFAENSANTLLKTVGHLTAEALIKDHSDDDGCAAGMLPGQERYYEIYPDGSIKRK